MPLEPSRSGRGEAPPSLIQPRAAASQSSQRRHDCRRGWGRMKVTRHDFCVTLTWCEDWRGCDAMGWVLCRKISAKQLGEMRTKRIWCREATCQPWKWHCVDMPFIHVKFKRTHLQGICPTIKLAGNEVSVMNPARMFRFLLFNPRRHSQFHHPRRDKRGDGIPRVWLLIDLELRLKNLRVAWHETKSLIPEFKVQGQPVTPLRPVHWPENDQNAIPLITCVPRS